MPHETALIATMSVALALAFVGEFLAIRLRLPAMVGYLGRSRHVCGTMPAHAE